MIQAEFNKLKYAVFDTGLNSSEERSKSQLMGKSSKMNFKILLVYPNLSMMMAPPVSYGIFTRLLKNEGYEVDIFDCTPYIGEGSSVDGTRESVLEVPAAMER